jgi:hypothetical protein
MSNDASENRSQNASEIDLNMNPLARIRNPLAGISRAQLLLDVRRFAQERELVNELPFLIKGAIRESPLVDIDRDHDLTRWWD